MDVREKLVELIRKGARGHTLMPTESIANYLVEHGVTVQEWIPVKDRLPEYGQQVIVYTGNILSPMVMSYIFWDKDYDGFAHITHWMPLPEPPKGELLCSTNT